VTGCDPKVISARRPLPAADAEFRLQPKRDAAANAPLPQEIARRVGAMVRAIGASATETDCRGPDPERDE
jgi:hypothetical protein